MTDTLYEQKEALVDEGFVEDQAAKGADFMKEYARLSLKFANMGPIPVHPDEEYSVSLALHLSPKLTRPEAVQQFRRSNPLYEEITL